MRLQVCILTPDRIFQNKEVEEIILPTSTGQIGVLSNHAPLLTALDIGPIIFRKKSDWIALALIGGFALVQDNQVTILVNEAVASSSVEEREAIKTLEEATNRLNQVSDEKAKVEATFAFKRARARYQIVKWPNTSQPSFRMLLCLYLLKKYYVEILWSTTPDYPSSR
jgi:ATP synthase F1 epsilon subunit